MRPSHVSDEIRIVQIRFVKDAQFVTFMALSLAFGLYRLFLRHFVPNKEEDFDIWYKSEIRDFYLRIAGEPIILVE